MVIFNKRNFCQQPYNHGSSWFIQSDPMFLRPRVEPDCATLLNMGEAAQFAQAHRRCQETATLADVVSYLFLIDLQ